MNSEYIYTRCFDKKKRTFNHAFENHNVDHNADCWNFKGKKVGWIPVTLRSICYCYLYLIYLKMHLHSMIKFEVSNWQHGKSVTSKADKKKFTFLTISLFKKIYLLWKIYFVNVSYSLYYFPFTWQELAAISSSLILPSAEDFVSFSLTMKLAVIRNYSGKHSV